MDDTTRKIQLGRLGDQKTLAMTDAELIDALEEGSKALANGEMFAESNAVLLLREAAIRLKATRKA